MLCIIFIISHSRIFSTTGYTLRSSVPSIDAPRRVQCCWPTLHLGALHFLCLFSDTNRCIAPLVIISCCYVSRLTPFDFLDPSFNILDFRLSLYIRILHRRRRRRRLYFNHRSSICKVDASMAHSMALCVTLNLYRVFCMNVHVSTHWLNRRVVGHCGACQTQLVLNYA